MFFEYIPNKKEYLWYKPTASQLPPFIPSAYALAITIWCKPTASQLPPFIPSAYALAIHGGHSSNRKARISFCASTSLS